MNILKKARFSVLFVVIFSIFSFSYTVQAASKTIVTGQDLGVESAGLLPSNPFYFIKDWSRGFKRGFVFDGLKKAQSEQDTLNEIGAEFSKLSFVIKDNNLVFGGALKSYSDGLNRLTDLLPTLDKKNPLGDKFLGKLVFDLVNQIQLFDELSSRVSEPEKVVFNEAIAAQMKLLGVAIGNLSQIDDVRLRFGVTLDKMQVLKLLRQAEIIEKVQDVLGAPAYKLNRIKQDLLVEVAARLSASNILPEDIIGLNGDVLVRLRVIENIRLKVMDPKASEYLDGLRESLIKSLNLDKDGSVGFLELANKKIQTLKVDVLLQDKNASVMNLIGRADASLSEAAKMYNNKQYNEAAVQILGGLNAIDLANYYLFSQYDYKNELVWLDQNLTELRKNKEKSFLLPVLDKRLDLMKKIIASGATFPDGDMENLILELKFLLVNLKLEVSK